MKIAIEKIIFDSTEPIHCMVEGCKEKYNALWYVFLRLNKMRVIVNLCEKHKNRLEQKAKRIGGMKYEI